MFPRLFCVFFGKYQDKMLEFLLLFKENVYFINVQVVYTDLYLLPHKFAHNICLQKAPEKWTEDLFFPSVS